MQVCSGSYVIFIYLYETGALAANECSLCRIHYSYNIYNIYIVSTIYSYSIYSQSSIYILLYYQTVYSQSVMKPYS